MGEETTRTPVRCEAAVVPRYPLPYGGIVSAPVEVFTLSTCISSVPISRSPRDTAVASATIICVSPALMSSVRYVA